MHEATEPHQHNRLEHLANIDVLIVGAGPAGMITAAQLSRFPNLNVRLIERRTGRLEVGQADGIQARSLETFQAFGFAGRLAEEAYRVNEIMYWKPDPVDPSRIVRTGRTVENDPPISEFPHLIVNQARVLDYFAEYMLNSPARMVPDYGVEFVSFTVHKGEEYPVEVTLRHVGADADETFTLRTKYLVGADGARSRVRQYMGLELRGTSSDHAWGVLDALTATDFPDIRKECVIQSESDGNILLVPREGGYLTRFYIDLGDTDHDSAGAIRSTPVGDVVERANRIMHPYHIEVRSVAWYSVYEVGHRLTDFFDDVSGTDRAPHVFIAGDACHTHSAKAGQGMNVSLQDGFNLGWKLAHALTGAASIDVLRTYSEERREVAQNLIDFDREWSTLMAQTSGGADTLDLLMSTYLDSTKFTSGFMTEYQPSIITADRTHQRLAAGFPIGQRFRSAPVDRVCDGDRRQLGHDAVADGRWRVYVFDDADEQFRQLTDLAQWLTASASAPTALSDEHSDEHTEGPRHVLPPAEVNLILQTPHLGVSLLELPQVFRPLVGPYALENLENVYAACPDADIFDSHEIDRRGAVVIVRPDQYVSAVLPLDQPSLVGDFFAAFVQAE